MMKGGRSILRGVLLAGVALLLLLAPSQFAFRVAGLHITPADALLILLAPLALAVAWAEGMGWRRLLAVPFPNAVFVLLALLSSFVSGQLTTGLGECVQFALYFLVADRVFLIARGPSSPADRGPSGVRPDALAVGAFLAIGAVVVLIALGQLFTPSADGTVDPLSVRGTFGNRNVLGGYLALLLPFAFGLLLAPSAAPGKSVRGIVPRLLLLLLLLAGLCTILSGGALFAIGLAVFAFSLARGRIAAVLTVLALTGFLVFVAPVLPRENLYTTIRSVELYDSETGERTRRYPEWQAAVTMAFERPWVGMGPGTYQSNIGTFYDIIPRATGPSEPDIQNLHLVLLSTCGFPAYFAFLAIFLTSVFSGWRSRDPVARAAACSLVAFLIAAIWHPLLVRGIGVPMAFLLSLARDPSAAPGSSEPGKCATIPQANREG